MNKIHDNITLSDDLKEKYIAKMDIICIISNMYNK